MLMRMNALQKQQVELEQDIVFVIDALKVGGSEKFLITLLNSFARKGYNPCVILLSDNNPLLSELDPEVQVEIFARKSKFDLGVSKDVRTFIKENGIRKVFCVDPFSFFMAKWIFFFDKNISFYLSLHHTLPTSFKYFLLNFTYFRLLRKNDSVVYICNNQKDYFQKKYFIGHHKSYVIYNGIDTDYFSPDNVNKTNKPDIDALKSGIGLATSDKVILKVASFRPEKRHNHAVEALGILHLSHQQPAHLVFVGAKDSDATYIKELKTQAKRLGVADYLHFVPMQSDVRPYLMMADIYTLTSHTETFSLSALEAMSFGLPCSLTNIGGASEMIEVNKTGTLSTPGDPATIAASWNTLLNLEIDREYIRDRVLKSFSSELMIKQYEALLS